MFIVHEFATAPLAQGSAQNKLALAQFLGDVTGAVAPDDDWWLLGPFGAPADGWQTVPLYIGHLTSSGSRQSG